MQDQLRSTELEQVFHTLANVLPTATASPTSTATTLLLACILDAVVTHSLHSMDMLAPLELVESTQPVLMQRAQTETEQSLNADRRMRQGQAESSLVLSLQTCAFLVEQLLLPLADVGAKEKLHCKHAARVLQMHLCQSVRAGAEMQQQLQECHASLKLLTG